MRIRELYLKDFRSFQGEHTISFVDPVTNQVRPVSVIAGSNGTGKTTILDAIEGLLKFVITGKHNDLTSDVNEKGLICLALELLATDLPQTSQDQQTPLNDDQFPQIVHIISGRQDLLPPNSETRWPNIFGYYVVDEDKKHVHTAGNGHILQNKLAYAIHSMHQNENNMHGGLIHFPHDRRLNPTQGGPIQPPSQEPSWNYHFSPSNHWGVNNFGFGKIT